MAGAAAEGIVAVVPAYQEAAAIERVVRGIVPHLPVLVVDDGSTDATAELAEAAGARVIRQPVNQGKGAALRAGFRAALEDGAAAATVLDGDGQHDPVEIPAFVAAWRQTHADLVVGVRDFARMPASRRIANVVGRLVFSWAVGRPSRTTSPATG